MNVREEGPRRTRRIGGALALTFVSALLPGTGYLWSGRRWAGALTLAVFLAVVGGAVVLVGSRQEAVELASDSDRLRLAAVVLGVLLVAWAGVVVSTYLLVRPRGLSWPRRLGGNTVVLLLCAALAAPVAVASRYATVQSDLVEEVFEDNRTATTPRDVTREDPWGGRDRVSVLLLGGDGSITRPGVRTDTIIVVTVDTGTGAATMFSLPRNLMHAPFPEGTTLHELYPYGFTGEGDPGQWLLNAVYGQVPALHPGVLGGSRNEGADAVKLAVSGTLGIPVDYYVLVNLGGFEQIVDAMGGVTVDINERVAIEGNTDLGIPPVDYLEPGPDQRLNGHQALWFARGRWGSDDYSRMRRQRCLVDAIIDEAHPLNLLRRYQALVAAGKRIVRTDIPAELLPAFVDLALKVKEAPVRSVAFVASERFAPADPDFAWVHETVRKALEPPVRHDGPRRPPATPEPTAPPADPTPGDEEAPDPGEAVDVAESCAFQPAS